MAEPKEDSLTDMVSMMKDTNIKDDVRHILGAHGQGIQTWGDVNTFMNLNAKYLEPGIVVGVKEKLRGAVKEKKQEQGLIRALKEAQEDSMPNAKHNGRATGFEGVSKNGESAAGKKVSNQSTSSQQAESSASASALASASAPAPGPPPPRDYRTPQDPTDHGSATRHQLLNPVPYPCTPS
ncbi:MAG: hypothetical protein ALECFALPRED_009017, partial [Alectoria fallacina]